MTETLPWRDQLATVMHTPTLNELVQRAADNGHEMADPSNPYRKAPYTVLLLYDRTRSQTAAVDSDL